MALVELELTPDGTATITLNDPTRRNALTPAFAQELVGACEAIDGDPQVRAAVVRGEGPAFCAGADREVLRGIAQDPTVDAAYNDLRLIYAAFSRVGRLTVPTIAAVHGPAIGAGFNLALATDVRVVTPEAKLAAGFGQLGVHPGGGHFTLVNRLLGRDGAAAMGLFGQSVGGERAVEIGLAWACVSSDELLSTCRSIADGTPSDPTLARAFVASMRATVDCGVPWESAIALEQGAQMWSFRRSPFASPASAS